MPYALGDCCAFAYWLEVPEERNLTRPGTLSALLRNVDTNLFLQLDVEHSGRTTHKIIAQITDEKWLVPACEEQLKESLHSMAAEQDWTLDGREPGLIGAIPYVPQGEPLRPANAEEGLTVWEILPT